MLETIGYIVLGIAVYALVVKGIFNLNSINDFRKEL